KKALAMNPNNAQAANDLAWIYTDAKKDHKAAVELADKAIQLDPDNYHLRDTRGVTLMNLGRQRDARADFQRAVDLLHNDPDAGPDLIRALLQLARCQAKLNEIPQAQASAGEAL